LQHALFLWRTKTKFWMARQSDLEARDGRYSVACFTL
jgi:hypothetical protein